MLKYGNDSGLTPGMRDAVLGRIRARRIGRGAAVVADAELVEHHGRDDRGEIDDAVDVVGRSDLLAGVEFRIGEGIAVLAAVVIVRIAEKDLLAGGELVIDLFVPAVAVQAAAGFDGLQVVGGPGPALRSRPRWASARSRVERNFIATGSIRFFGTILPGSGSAVQVPFTWRVENGL